ncbi:MAG TPA: hypothetical protein VOB72_26770, partial [Candidatus Dormibacteraeota bacterium]|nr:hypothetical protein [Candidatus Dormibacteraeota bacterium]
MTLAIIGTIAPLAPGAEQDSFHGRVRLGDDGRVAEVTRTDRDGPGAPADHEIDAGDAFVYPGLIDLHSHLAYNALPLWTDPRRTTPYPTHRDWPNAPTYASSISWPSWTLLHGPTECLLAYVQVRALAGGTTAIQGWPPLSRPPVNRLVRCVEQDHVGPLPDPVSVSVVTLSPVQLGQREKAMEAGQVFAYHCAEGRQGTAVWREFSDVRNAGCLRRELAAIHCCAAQEADFEAWAKLSPPGIGPAGTVVWSPLSNLWLYGVTTDVPSALRAGLAACLGTDWGPSGTRNLLAELKVARLWSDHQGWGLTDHDLVTMVTAAPGDVLARAWRVPAGRLVAGALGDAVVIARRAQDPWANLVAAREADVLLVVKDGQAVYGTEELLARAGQSVSTEVALGPDVRRVVLRLPSDPTQPWDWADVLRRLEAVRADAAVHPP